VPFEVGFALQCIEHGVGILAAKLGHGIAKLCFRDPHQEGPDQAVTWDRGCLEGPVVMLDRVLPLNPAPSDLQPGPIDDVQFRKIVRYDIG